MKCSKQKILTVEFKGQEISDFQKIIEKCKNEDKRIGFGVKLFSENEMKIINNIKF